MINTVSQKPNTYHITSLGQNGGVDGGCESNRKGSNAALTVLVESLYSVDKTTAVREVSPELVPVLAQFFDTATVWKLGFEVLVDGIRVIGSVGPASITSRNSLVLDVLSYPLNGI